jgi:hypothetical protein
VRAAARQQLQTARQRKYAPATGLFWQNAGCRLPATSPAEECRLRHATARSKGRGRRGNRGGGKAQGCCCLGPQCRDACRERSREPYQTAPPYCRSRQRRCHKPSQARQLPARAGVARSRIIEQGRRSERCISAQLAAGLARERQTGRSHLTPNGWSDYDGVNKIANFLNEESSNIV